MKESRLMNLEEAYGEAASVYENARIAVRANGRQEITASDLDIASRIVCGVDAPVNMFRAPKSDLS